MSALELQALLSRAIAELRRLPCRAPCSETGFWPSFQRPGHVCNRCQVIKDFELLAPKANEEQLK